MAQHHQGPIWSTLSPFAQKFGMDWCLEKHQISTESYQRGEQVLTQKSKNHNSSTNSPFRSWAQRAHRLLVYWHRLIVLIVLFRWCSHHSLPSPLLPWANLPLRKPTLQNPPNGTSACSERRLWQPLQSVKIFSLTPSHWGFDKKFSLTQTNISWKCFRREPVRLSRRKALETSAVCKDVLCIALYFLNIILYLQNSTFKHLLSSPIFQTSLLVSSLDYYMDLFLIYYLFKQPIISPNCETAMMSACLVVHRSCLTSVTPPLYDTNYSLSERIWSQ